MVRSFFLEKTMAEQDLRKKLEEEYAKLFKAEEKPNVLVSGDGEETRKKIGKAIFGRDFSNADESKPVHLVWYCVSCRSGKVAQEDMEKIESFHESGIPTAIVLTDADSSTDEKIREIKSSLPAWAKDSTFESFGSGKKGDQLKGLTDWSVERLPEKFRDAFIKIQKINIDEKWKKSHAIIVQHTIGAGAIGFTPIPFSDAPLLVANEMALLARVLYLYDLDSIFKTLESIGLSSVLGPLLSSGGKALAASLFKLLPGVGTVVGGVISGTVGAVVTAAFGEAASAAAYAIHKAKLNGDNEKAKQLVKDFGPTVMALSKLFIKQKKKPDDYRLPAPK